MTAAPKPPERKSGVGQPKTDPKIPSEIERQFGDAGDAITHHEAPAPADDPNDTILFHLRTRYPTRPAAPADSTDKAHFFSSSCAVGLVAVLKASQ